MASHARGSSTLAGATALRAAPNAWTSGETRPRIWWQMESSVVPSAVGAAMSTALRPDGDPVLALKDPGVAILGGPEHGVVHPPPARAHRPDPPHDVPLRPTGRERRGQDPAAGPSSSHPARADGGGDVDPIHLQLAGVAPAKLRVTGCFERLTSRPPPAVVVGAQGIASVPVPSDRKARMGFGRGLGSGRGPRPPLVSTVTRSRAPKRAAGRATNPLSGEGARRSGGNCLPSGTERQSTDRRRGYTY